MVVCQPGTIEVAKSKDTMVCTDKTSGVLNPASTSARASCLCQCFVEPLQPNDNTPYINFLHFNLARSRMVPKSGNNPVYQNKRETVKYVEIANTSHRRGELKFTQIGPLVLGYGKTKNAIH